MTYDRCQTNTTCNYVKQMKGYLNIKIIYTYDINGYRCTYTWRCGKSSVVTLSSICILGKSFFIIRVRQASEISFILKDIDETKLNNFYYDILVRTSKKLRILGSNFATNFLQLIFVHVIDLI